MSLFFCFLFGSLIRRERILWKTICHTKVIWGSWFYTIISWKYNWRARAARASSTWESYEHIQLGKYFSLSFQGWYFFFFFGQFLCLLHFLSIDNLNNFDIFAITLADLCNNKEWIDSDRSVDAGFSVGSDGWWDSLVHSLVNDRHKHLQIPHRKAPSSTRRHCHFRRCYGHSRCVANRDPPRAFL